MSKPIEAATARPGIEEARSTVHNNMNNLFIQVPLMPFRPRLNIERRFNGAGGDNRIDMIFSAKDRHVLVL